MLDLALNPIPRAGNSKRKRRVLLNFELRMT